MKRTMHSFHLGENVKTGLFAFGFSRAGYVAFLSVLVCLISSLPAESEFRTLYSQNTRGRFHIPSLKRKVSFLTEAFLVVSIPLSILLCD